MITERDSVFRLSTRSTSYWFRITKFGHPEHIYYGARLPDDDSAEAPSQKRTAYVGSSIAYDPSDPLYCLDNMRLEWSGIGCGDYREPPCEIKMPNGSFSCDFVYASHEIRPGCVGADTLPGAYGSQDECQTLIVTLEDSTNSVGLSLYYTVYADSDVITRRTVLTNRSENPLVIKRLMSLCVDLPDRGYTLTTFDGGWSKEACRHDRPLQYGLYVNSSSTGASSNRHNPGFVLSAPCACEDHGAVYGFNLIYSGNHCGFAERSNYELVRVGIGINPLCFEWELKTGERFETPEAVMTFSDGGFNAMSHNFHDFVNRHIVRGDYRGRERPVLINSWEACFFKFTEGKLIRLAKRANRLGAELFVLDDGWFKGRDSDKAGLGDYEVNRRKFPFGLRHFANRIRKTGMDFGLWIEPEMVNPDSDLFRAHPDWAVTVPGKKPELGRNQLVLDLCRLEVRDYIVDSVSKILDESGAGYVKWDMNRHISDAYSSVLSRQGEFCHRYMLGLYEVLRRIFAPRPQILLESCASGGDRFDLGMLCYCQQIWASDDTDPGERLKIQHGLSYLYPLSAIGAHISESPHQQTLRETPLATRFNVAAFGCLGLELQPKMLSSIQRRELREQIAFYKRHRATLQFGRFYRADGLRPDKRVWQCVSADGGESVAGYYQTLSSAGEGEEYLPLHGLLPQTRYAVKTKPQRLFVKRFGGLVKHLLPVELNPEGLILRTVNRHFALGDCVEEYEGFGSTLMSGVSLSNQFIGSWYNPQTRMLGDFGSNLYVIRKI